MSFIHCTRARAASVHLQPQQQHSSIVVGVMLRGGLSFFFQRNVMVGVCSWSLPCVCRRSARTTNHSSVIHPSSVWSVWFDSIKDRCITFFSRSATYSYTLYGPTPYYCLLLLYTLGGFSILHSTTTTKCSIQINTAVVIIIFRLQQQQFNMYDTEEVDWTTLCSSSTAV